LRRDYTTRRAEVERPAPNRPHRPEFAPPDVRSRIWEKWGHEMKPNSLKRARHVVTENLRTRLPRGVGCHDLAELGR